MRGVVLMPAVEETRRSKSAGAQQEAGKIRDSSVVDDIDGREDDVADEGQHHAEAKVQAALAVVIRGAAHTEQDYGADAVGSDGIEVSFHFGVALERR